MPDSTLEHPELLGKLMEGAANVLTLAQEHGMSPVELAQWLTSSDVQRSIAAVRLCADVQAQLVLSRYRVHAVDRMVKVMLDDAAPVGEQRKAAHVVMCADLDRAAAVVPSEPEPAEAAQAVPTPEEEDEAEARQMSPEALYLQRALSVGDDMFVPNLMHEYGPNWEAIHKTRNQIVDQWKAVSQRCLKLGKPIPPGPQRHPDWMPKFAPANDEPSAGEAEAQAGKSALASGGGGEDPGAETLPGAGVDPMYRDKPWLRYNKYRNYYLTYPDEPLGEEPPAEVLRRVPKLLPAEDAEAQAGLSEALAEGLKDERAPPWVRRG